MKNVLYIFFCFLIAVLYISLFIVLLDKNVVYEF